MFSSRAADFWCKHSLRPSRCEQIVRRYRQKAASRQTVKTLRRKALDFTRDKEFRSLVAANLLGENNQSEQFRIRARLWAKMDVLILDGAVATPIGDSLKFSTAELRLIEAGYERLRDAVENAVGLTRAEEFSHVWGAGGFVAKLGSKTVGGQFGLMDSLSPSQVNVVVDVAASGFTPNEIAQRLAHENAHSQDVLLGMVRWGNDFHWSETSEAKIFAGCEELPKYNTELYRCRTSHPSWFNFHPTDYSAYNSAEFYASMVNEWVRVHLKLKVAGSYQCQNKQTELYWTEMEENFLGEKVSSECRN